MQQDFVPVTYLLPADYSIFVEEFRRNPNGPAGIIVLLLLSLLLLLLLLLVLLLGHRLSLVQRVVWLFCSFFVSSSFPCVASLSVCVSLPLCATGVCAAGVQPCGS